MRFWSRNRSASSSGQSRFSQLSFTGIAWTPSTPLPSGQAGATSAYPRAFPGALASWPIPPHGAFGWHLLRKGEPPRGYFVPHSGFALTVEPAIPPGYLLDARQGGFHTLPSSPRPFGPSLTRVGLSSMTTV